MMLQVPSTSERLPSQLAESLEKAIRVAYDPPSVEALGDMCRGTPAFLARQPVMALHRLLDVGRPSHRQSASLLAASHAEMTLWRLLLRVPPREPFKGARRGGTLLERNVAERGCSDPASPPVGGVAPIAV